MLPCPIVKDLLPSYVKENASPKSVQAVEDHLRGCESCRAARDTMAKAGPRRNAPGKNQRLQTIGLLLLVMLTFVFTYVVILTLNRLVEVNALHSLGLFLLISLACGTLIAWAFRRKRKRTLLVLCLIFLVLGAAALTLVLIPFSYTLRIFMILFGENNGEFIGMLLWLTILSCTGMAGGLGIGSLLGHLWRKGQEPSQPSSIKKESR